MAAKSPFPGVDPYIEQWRWGDFHNSVTTYLRDALNERLPADLRSRSTQRVYVDNSAPPDLVMVRTPTGRRKYEPDVAVVHSSAVRGIDTTRAAVLVAEDDVISLPTMEFTIDVEVHENSIEIVESRSGDRVVTVIEIVSPGNRIGGAGRKAYLRKQRDCRRSGINFVEIDLVRAGRSVTEASATLQNDPYGAPHHISIWDAGRPDNVECYVIGLRSPIATIGVPLRQGEPRIPAKLQRLYATAYERGRYDDIDYSRPLVPPVREPDAAWVAEVVAARIAQLKA